MFVYVYLGVKMISSIHLVLLAVTSFLRAVTHAAHNTSTHASGSSHNPSSSPSNNANQNNNPPFEPVARALQNTAVVEISLSISTFIYLSISP